MSSDWLEFSRAPELLTAEQTDEHDTVKIVDEDGDSDDEWIIAQIDDCLALNRCR